MNNIYGGLLIAGAIVVASVIKYKDEINGEIQKIYGNIKAKKITVDFFLELHEKNRYITLDEAILKFENSNENSLEEFAKTKNRTAEGYREAYSDMYYKAKEKYYKKNKVRNSGISFNNFFE